MSRTASTTASARSVATAWVRSHVCEVVMLAVEGEDLITARRCQTSSCSSRSSRAGGGAGHAGLGVRRGAWDLPTTVSWHRRDTRLRGVPFPSAGRILDEQLEGLAARLALMRSFPSTASIDKLRGVLFRTQARGDRAGDAVDRGRAGLHPASFAYASLRYGSGYFPWLPPSAMIWRDCRAAMERPGRGASRSSS